MSDHRSELDSVGVGTADERSNKSSAAMDDEDDLMNRKRRDLLHSGFFKEAEKQFSKRLTNLRPFKGQEIANILWSFATLNAQPDPALIDALSSIFLPPALERKAWLMNIRYRNYSRDRNWQM